MNHRWRCRLPTIIERHLRGLSIRGNVGRFYGGHTMAIKWQRLYVMTLGTNDLNEQPPGVTLSSHHLEFTGPSHATALMPSIICCSNHATGTNISCNMYGIIIVSYVQSKKLSLNAYFDIQNPNLRFLFVSLHWKHL